MKIAILVAMQKELNLFLPLLEDCRESKLDIFTVWHGRMGKHELIVAQTGIGKVNSALTAYSVISEENPDLVINTGVAGGAGGVGIGTLLVADYAAYHDVWCGPGTRIGNADGCDLYLPTDGKVLKIAKEMLDPEQTAFGLICSGDRFISLHEEVCEIRKNFPDVKAIDMESASIAHVCSLKGVPFNILRVVSDTPGEGENIEQYENFWKDAPYKTFSAVKAIVEAL